MLINCDKIPNLSVSNIIQSMRYLFLIPLYMGLLWLGGWHCGIAPLDCKTDEDCSMTERYCIDGVCKECRSGDDCSSGKCDTNMRICVESEVHGVSELAGEIRSEYVPDSGGEVIPEELVGTDLLREHIPENHLPENHLPENHLPENHLPENHLPENHLMDTAKTEGETEGETETITEFPPSICPMPTRPCYTATSGCIADGGGGFICKGICKAGTEICVDGRWSGICAREVTPQPEVCGDGQDNNCDGVIDESCPCDFLSLAVGVCKNSKIDASGKCAKPKDYESPETSCNDGKDNDCNGKIDKEDPHCVCQIGDTRECYNAEAKTKGVGICKAGTQVCIKQADGSYKWSDCQGQVTPQPEICDDSKDNNCDGVIDEGCPCHYLDKPHGVCKDLKRDSKGNCPKPAEYSVTEICNGKDNNCDGAIDEGCPCHYLDKPHGVCKDLKRDSQGNCPKPAEYSVTEICNGKDNNCDGVIDESCLCHYLDKPHGVCKDLKRDSQGNCPKPAEYSVTEICNGKDNNCDGAIDEGCPCHYLDRPFGICRGLKRDSQGNCPKPSGYSEIEICDYMDNNCDPYMAIDEGCPCHYLDKPQGVCKDQIRDEYGFCPEPAEYSKTEICNDGKDNNCNGAIDEGCPCHYLDKREGVCGYAQRDDKGVCQIDPRKYYSETEICDGDDNDCNGANDDLRPSQCYKLKDGVCFEGWRRCILDHKYNYSEICEPHTSNGVVCSSIDDCVKCPSSAGGYLCQPLIQGASTKYCQIAR